MRTVCHGGFLTKVLFLADCTNGQTYGAMCDSLIWQCTNSA